MDDMSERTKELVLNLDMKSKDIRKQLKKEMKRK
jgi:hypothetical protein